MTARVEHDAHVQYVAVCSSCGNVDGTHMHRDEAEEAAAAHNQAYHRHTCFWSDELGNYAGQDECVACGSQAAA